MKITKHQLREIIEEAIRLPWQHEDEDSPPSGDVLPPRGNNIKFEWAPGGLSMQMMVDGEIVLRFNRQREVEELIEQLKELLDGPMRTSP